MSESSAVRDVLTARFGITRDRAEDEGFSEQVIDEIVECVEPFCLRAPAAGEDLAEQLRISQIGHAVTTQALGDVKRELAHYKAGEQPRVEDRDREIAALKARPPAPPAAPRCPTCEGTCNPFVASCGAQFCDYEEMARHQCEPAAPAPASPEEK